MTYFNIVEIIRYNFTISINFPVLILLIWITFYVPFNVCFEYEESDVPKRLIIHELIVDISFGVDIILNFLTGYIDSKTKRLVTKPKLIAIRYLKGFFIIDVVATVPFGYVINNPSLQITFLGKLGKLPKMIKILVSISFSFVFFSLKLFLLFTIEDHTVT